MWGAHSCRKGREIRTDGLADHAPFNQCFSDWLKMIWEQGTEEALRTYTKG